MAVNLDELTRSLEKTDALEADQRLPLLRRPRHERVRLARPLPAHGVLITNICTQLRDGPELRLRLDVLRPERRGQRGGGRPRSRPRSRRRRPPRSGAAAASRPRGPCCGTCSARRGDPQRGPRARAGPRRAAQAGPRGLSGARPAASRCSTTCSGSDAVRRRQAAHSTASPVLVGAVTVLVTIVAVFLSYNANPGLPFVPTYDLKANLPNAAQLVKGFEVRIGGARVGLDLEDRAEAARRRHHLRAGHDEARQGASSRCRPTRRCSCARARRSASSTSSSTPGPARRDLPAGATIPVPRRGPRSVELDDFFNMFDDKARVGSRNSLDGFGGGLAGRGQDLNTAIQAFVPLLERPRAGRARTWPAPDTRLGRFFSGAGATPRARWRRWPRSRRRCS